MIINDTNINSNTELLGNSAKTVGDYLSELYPDSSSTYALEQLTSGDNGSQSIIITSGRIEYISIIRKQHIPEMIELSFPIIIGAYAIIITTKIYQKYYFVLL